MKRHFLYRRMERLFRHPRMERLKYVLPFACLVPLMLLRDFTPDNELRYLSIADEALRDGHLFAFWNHGVMYADKPPLYLWIVMLGRWLFGGHCMFFLALFSLLPAFAVARVMERWTAPEMPGVFRRGARMTLLTSGLFLGAALVVRMDMLMCLFIVLALRVFHRLYSGGARRGDGVKLPLCIFLAVFTKGPVGILVPLLSIAVFLCSRGKLREFGRYLGWRQWGLMLGLAAVWFAGAWLEGGGAYLHDLLFRQTVGRAVDAFHHKEPVWYYLKTVWYSLAPWTMLYFTTIFIGIRKRLLGSDLKRLFVTVIAVTFAALSLVSGKLDIYLLPVFPFVAYLAFLILPDIPVKWVRFTVGCPASVMALVFPAVFFLPETIGLDWGRYFYLMAVALVLSLAAVMCLVRLLRKHFLEAVGWLAAGLLLTVFAGSFAVVELNERIGMRKLCEKAKRFEREDGVGEYYYYNFRGGKDLDVYLGRRVDRIALDGIVALVHERDYLLFLRDKDLMRDNRLQRAVSPYPFRRAGDYCVFYCGWKGYKSIPGRRRRDTLPGGDAPVFLLLDTLPRRNAPDSLRSDTLPGGDAPAPSRLYTLPRGDTLAPWLLYTLPRRNAPDSLRSDTLPGGNMPDSLRRDTLPCGNALGSSPLYTLPRGDTLAPWLLYKLPVGNAPDSLRPDTLPGGNALAPSLLDTLPGGNTPDSLLPAGGEE